MKSMWCSKNGLFQTASQKWCGQICCQKARFFFSFVPVSEKYLEAFGSNNFFPVIFQENVTSSVFWSKCFALRHVPTTFFVSFSVKSKNSLLTVLDLDPFFFLHDGTKQNVRENLL